MKSKRLWINMAIVAGLGLVAWFVAGLVLAGKVPPIPPGAMQPVLLRGGRVVGDHMSTKNWSFVYGSAQLSADGVLATVTRLRKGIVFKKGKPYLAISAEHATVNTQTFDFTAAGTVHVTQLSGSTSPRSFETDYIQWINATKQLSLPHPSIVRSGSQTLRIASVNVDVARSQIKLSGISGAISP